jgi:hypothetical protein
MQQEVPGVGGWGQGGPLTNAAVSTQELLLWLSALWGHGTWQVGPVSSDSIIVFVFRLQGTLKMEEVCSFEALDPSAGPQLGRPQDEIL